MLTDTLGEQIDVTPDLQVYRTENPSVNQSPKVGSPGPSLRQQARGFSKYEKLALRVENNKNWAPTELASRSQLYASPSSASLEHEATDGRAMEGVSEQKQMNKEPSLATINELVNLQLEEGDPNSTSGQFDGFDQYIKVSNMI